VRVTERKVCYREGDMCEREGNTETEMCNRGGGL